MIATVRLDEKVENVLNSVCDSLHKKKSEVIREAILFYGQSLKDAKKSRLQKAIEKTGRDDYSEYLSMEGTLNDGLKG